MKIAAVQLAPEFGLPEFNLDRAISLSAHEDAELFVYPELCTSGYQFLDRGEVDRFAEEIPDGPTTERLTGFAGSLEVHVVCGLPEKKDDRLYNSAVVVGPDGFIGVYRKTHLFRREKELFDPGDTGFQVFEIGDARLGVMICFDWIFPEAARALALKGADIIAVPANLVLPWCQQAMVIRSYENRVHTVLANRWGLEVRGGLDPLSFTGGSQVVAADGTVLATLGPEEDAAVIGDVDLEMARDKRVTPENDVVSDRRPSFYRTLLT